MNPLKQGLKLYANEAYSIYLLVKEVNPLKQGLKPFKSPNLEPICESVKEVNPLKQGLKPRNISMEELIDIC